MVEVVEVATDICDRCPAEAKVQAYVYADHPSWASSLAYCAHHGTRFIDALYAAGATVIDMRHKVLK